MATFSGWGENAWNVGNWGQGAISESVTLTGFSLSASLNSVTFQIDSSVTVTGEELQKVLESFVGIEAGGSISVPVFEGPISIVLQNVFVEADGQVEVTGQDITSVLGNVTINLDSSVTVTGFGLTTEINSVGIEASGNISVPVFENPMSINLGNAIAQFSIDAFPTGIEANLNLNSVSIESNG
jgi:hypothetical protein